MGMSAKSHICHFTGLKIDIGRGILFARNDGQVFYFLNSKAKQLYHHRKRPSKIGWTIAYRKLHKKGRGCEKLKRKKHTNVKLTLRAYSTVSTQTIQRKWLASPHTVLFNEQL